MPNARFDNNSPGQRRPRPTHLAACLATALGLGGLITPAIAANIVVTACSDADIVHPPLHLFGLRSSVLIANDGDTIDLTKLGTCTISLTDGAIPITVNNLEFVGPNSQTLTIDGQSSDRVFNHTGTGGILFENLTIAHGKTAGNGGCIQSAGTVDLFVNVTVTGCSASGKGGGIAAPYVQTDHSTISNNVGGGIYASGTRTSAPDAYLENSTISGNTGGAGLAGNCVGRVTIQNSMIENNASPTTSGGINMCCFGPNNASAVDVSYSSVVGNNGDKVDRFSGGICAEYVYLSRSNVSGNKGQVGGILTGLGNDGGYDFSAKRSTIADNIGYVETGGVSSSHASIEYSTISGNQSVQSEGGIRALTSRFVNSTISGNHGYYGGGISTNVATFFNSTVAFNASSKASSHNLNGNLSYSGGITNLNFPCPYCKPSISMASTIVANNGVGVLDTESDVYVVNTPTLTGTLIASNSLIMSSNVPSSSLTADPLLVPLASNGGPMQTHALNPHSPAIGTGSNPKPLGFDERGAGFFRSWINGQTDIGAYQTQDRIFYNGFE
jgi:hypothetical protein